MAAGRGFVHIQADGSIEPCPFSPYSDISIENTTLKDGLNSLLLKIIRLNHQLIRETKGGCALWENQDLIKSFLNVD